MSLPNPSPMDRHILDMLDRIERGQMDRLASLEERVRILEAQNDELKQRNDELEARLRSQDSGITALSDSLAEFLAPPDFPRA